MGCDIHLVLEKRDGGKWVGVDTFTSHHRSRPTRDDIMDGFSSPTARSRNYDRFAALAGVRGDGPEARGLPPDLSDTTALLASEWGDDGHSHSWLPLNEAARIFLETEWVPPGKELSESIKKYPEEHYFNVDRLEAGGGDDDNYRVVFWFDN